MSVKGHNKKRMERKRMAKAKHPPKPECGSLEINKMIDAFNRNMPNPCTENEECIRWWNKLISDSDKLERKYNERPYYSMIEPDHYEECLLRTLF